MASPEKQAQFCETINRLSDKIPPETCPTINSIIDTLRAINSDARSAKNCLNREQYRDALYWIEVVESSADDLIPGYYKEGYALEQLREANGNLREVGRANHLALMKLYGIVKDRLTDDELEEVTRELLI